VPQTLLALASEGHGVAVVPIPVVVRDARLRAVPLMHRGAPIGRWAAVAWDGRRFLAPPSGAVCGGTRRSGGAQLSWP